MRYIRTDDGKIIDLQAVNHSVRHAKIRKINNGDIKVVKQSDIIEKLVKNGDLVKVKEPITNRESTIIYNNLDLDYYELLTLWTEQNGNYIKVWTKEEGVI